MDLYEKTLGKQRYEFRRASVNKLKENNNKKNRNIKKGKSKQCKGIEKENAKTERMIEIKELTNMKKKN